MKCKLFLNLFFLITILPAFTIEKVNAELIKYINVGCENGELGYNSFSSPHMQPTEIKISKDNLIYIYDMVCVCIHVFDTKLNYISRIELDPYSIIDTMIIDSENDLYLYDDYKGFYIIGKHKRVNFIKMEDRINPNGYFYYDGNIFCFSNKGIFFININSGVKTYMSNDRIKSIFDRNYFNNEEINKIFLDFIKDKNIIIINNRVYVGTYQDMFKYREFCKANLDIVDRKNIVIDQYDNLKLTGYDQKGNSYWYGYTYDDKYVILILSKYAEIIDYFQIEPIVTDFAPAPNGDLYGFLSKEDGHEIYRIKNTWDPVESEKAGKKQEM